MKQFFLSAFRWNPFRVHHYIAIVVTLGVFGCKDQPGSASSSVAAALPLGDVQKLPIEVPKVEKPKVFPLTPVQQEIVLGLLDDDVGVWAEGGEAMMSRGTDFPSVSAEDLSKVYEVNELAADSRFKDREILVRGKLDSISKDALGNPYVVLQGHQPLFNVMLHFSKPIQQLGFLFDLKKSAKTAFHCKGAGLLLKQVMLKDCDAIDAAYLAAVKTKALERVREALTLGAPKPDSAIMLVSFAILMSENPRSAASCPPGAGSKCIKAVGQLNPTDADWKRMLKSLSDFGLGWATTMLNAGFADAG